MTGGQRREPPRVLQAAPPCPGSSIAVAGSVVTATFQIASGCTKVSVSLVMSRILPTGQTIFASSSRTFDAGGPARLTVSPPPDCPYESALVAQGQIVASVSGSNPCTVPTEPMSQQPPPSQGVALRTGRRTVAPWRPVSGGAGSRRAVAGSRRAAAGSRRAVAGNGGAAGRARGTAIATMAPMAMTAGTAVTVAARSDSGSTARHRRPASAPRHPTDCPSTLRRRGRATLKQELERAQECVAGLEEAAVERVAHDVQAHADAANQVGALEATLAERAGHGLRGPTASPAIRTEGPASSGAFRWLQTRVCRPLFGALLTVWTFP